MPTMTSSPPPPRSSGRAVESAVVSVFTERDGKLILDGQVTLPHAHMACVDPWTHLAYLPLQNVECRPLVRIMTARQP